MISPGEWHKKLRPALQKAKRITDDTNENPIVLDVLNMIEHCEVVFDKKNLNAGDKKVWYDKAGHVVWVWGKLIEDIAKPYAIELRKMKELFNGHMKGNSTVTRIGDNTIRVRLWPFNPDMLEGLNLTSPTSLDPLNSTTPPVNQPNPYPYTQSSPDATAPVEVEVRSDIIGTPGEPL